MKAILYGKRDFADVIKLRILRWGDCPGLSRWTLNMIIVYKREAEEDMTMEQEHKGNVTKARCDVKI